MDRPTNQNCRGRGALITHPSCRYCGRRYDPERDRQPPPDPRDDPKRGIEPRMIYT